MKTTSLPFDDILTSDEPDYLVPVSTIFDRLRRSRVCRLYRRTFEALTGLPLFIESVETVVSSRQNSVQNNDPRTPFCRLMNPVRNLACAQCPLSDHEPEENRPDGAHFRNPACKAGLRLLAAPIRFQNRTVAMIQTGSLALSRPTIETFLTKAASVWLVCQASKLEAAAEAWLQSPVVSAGQLNRFRSILQIFADRLSLSINRLLIEDDPRDPEWMRAVKALERDRADRSSHRNDFPHDLGWNYAIGHAGRMSFGEYADRCRLDRASGQLLNPDASFENVARSSGYESVESLEDDFRKLVGESPGHHRERVLECDRTLAGISDFPNNLPTFGRSRSLQ